MRGLACRGKPIRVLHIRSCPYFQKIRRVLQVVLTGSVTEYDTLVQIWVFLEMNVSVIAACLPTLAPILTLSVYARLWDRIYSFSSLRHHDPTQEQLGMKQRHTNSHHHKRHIDVTDVEMARILTDYGEQATQ